MPHLPLILDHSQLTANSSCWHGKDVDYHVPTKVNMELPAEAPSQDKFFTTGGYKEKQQ